jgi:hypothetical protein
MMTPHAGPTTQEVGTTKEVAPGRRKRRRGTPSLHYVKPKHSALERITEALLDLHCKCITYHEMFNIHRLLPVENKAIPQEDEYTIFQRFTTKATLLGQMLRMGLSFGSLSRFIGVTLRNVWAIILHLRKRVLPHL